MFSSLLLIVFYFILKRGGGLWTEKSKKIAESELFNCISNLNEYKKRETPELDARGFERSIR